MDYIVEVYLCSGSVGELTKTHHLLLLITQLPHALELVGTWVQGLGELIIDYSNQVSCLPQLPTKDPSVGKSFSISIDGEGYNYPQIPNET